MEARGSSTDEGRPRFWAMALTLLVAWTLAGCESFMAPGGQSNLSKQVLEVKLLAERILDEQGQSKRTVDYRLETLEQKIQTRSDQLTGSLSDTDKQIRQQNEEIASLKKELSELAFQIDALIKQLELKPATPSQESAKLLAPSQAGSAAYADAYKQYGLGRYAEARQGFEQALAQGLTGDMAVQAQFYLAESYYRQSEIKTAYDVYTKLITSNPSHALAWQSLERLAEINQKQGRSADALRLYEKILTTYPNYEGIERVKEQIQALKGAAAGGEAKPASPAPASPGAAAQPRQPPPS